jgi:NAD-dependent deacetylase
MEPTSELIDALRGADKLIIFTGAGMSAESGIRTFRDEMDGLWKEYSVEDIVSIEGFRRNPLLVWRWHEWFRSVADAAQPNPGHLAVGAVSDCLPEVIVVTQNIDGLHQRAGSQEVIELHGSVNRVRCSVEGCYVDEWSTGDEQPTCADCGALLRHDVVWFGEMLPEGALSSAMAQAAEADVLIAIGTSSVVYPAAQIPWIAKQAGARLVVVNPDQTPIAEICDDFLQGPAGQILPELFSQAWPETFRLPIEPGG